MNVRVCAENKRVISVCAGSAGGTIDLIVDAGGIWFGHYRQTESGVPEWVARYHIALSDAPTLIEAITQGVDKYMEVEE
jgi:hypothetical protein